MTESSDQNGDDPRGLALAVATYGLWGFLPLYMKALQVVPPTQIIVHRVLWSLPIAFAVLWVQHRARDVLQALRQPRLLAMAALTAALISVNWLIYVWAIVNDHALQAALGYYINPLFSIFLGWAMLGERLNRPQVAAIVLAATAVAILTWEAGSLPLVSLGLTFSWGFYAYFKRSLPLGPTQGFTLEVILLMPIALAYLAWVTANGTSAFDDSWTLALLLIGCGPITAVPLLMYATAAKLVRLSTMGVLQYIAPTMIFLTAVLIFGEPFDGAKRIAFPLIWAALVIYSVTLIRQARVRRRTRRELAAQRAQ
ncbi:EamA family transporter RarD (plasmid) [Paracoccus sp. TK19116]|uniref:EamA family transporter RarD n=1 Tax=Paracoccus albicereus TaxID=2922394 RepID=A0ABT1MPW4_9RHOB|nr:EamA family transporter RarD [Paracoccus albicereus]MCQ0968986.1 EamA family transporter RarD [Paracoccus albicereus]